MSRPVSQRQRISALLAAEPGRLDQILGIFEAPAVGSVTSPDVAAAVVRPHLAGHATERLVAVALDNRRRVIDVATLTEGNDAFTVVCTRQILRWALTRKRSASNVIIAHNHPSGDPKPSPQDRDATRRVAVGCRAVGLTLTDHIVIGDVLAYHSFAAEGSLPIYSDDPLA